MSNVKNIVDERLARGEITIDEHTQLIRTLASGDKTISAAQSRTIPTATNVLESDVENSSDVENLIREIDKPDNCSTLCPVCSEICDSEQAHCLECGSRIESSSSWTNTTQPTEVNSNLSSPLTALNALPSIAAEHSFATPQRRLGAYVIDFLIILVIQIVVGFLVGYVIGSGGGTVTGEEGFWQTISWIVFLTYFTLLESSPSQATFGKKILGLYVISDQHETISKPRALGRAAGKVLSSITIIGILLPFWTDRKKALHDFMSSTIVLQK